MEAESVIFLMRGLERLLISASGLISIYLGYRLFRTHAERQGVFESGVGSTYLKLRDVGPGVFFAVFGAIVLSVSIVYQAGTSKNESSSGGTNGESKYFLRKKILTDDEMHIKSIKAIYTLETYLLPTIMNSDDNTNKALVSAINALEPLKRELVNYNFGPGSYEKFNALSQLESTSPAAFEKQMKNEEIRQWYYHIESKIAQLIEE